MQFTNLAFFLFAASALALPEPEAAKKTKTKTKTKATATNTNTGGILPTGIVPSCAGQPFQAAQCTTARLGCVCYTLNLNNLLDPITFGACAGAGVSQTLMRHYSAPYLRLFVGQFADLGVWIDLRLSIIRFVWCGMKMSEWKYETCAHTEDTTSNEYNVVDHTIAVSSNEYSFYLSLYFRDSS